MKNKILISVVSFLLVFTCLALVSKANASKFKSSDLRNLEPRVVDPTTNFFTQKEDTRLVDVVDKSGELTLRGYNLVAENSDLMLYRLDRTMGIAIVDKKSGYTWFSSYENMANHNLTDSVVARIESGVSIEYFDPNAQTITYNSYSLTSQVGQKKEDVASIEYDKITNGFKAHIDFHKVGIKFDVDVYIDGNDLIVDVPYESVVETTVGKLNPKDYKLKSVTVFPYFGSQNYEINGYSFIPDGSGALIRYKNEVSSTAFTKKVYGSDYGIATKSTLNDHIKESGNVTLPIYGVNHGYNQAAFLCQITSGDGAAELHSYPYQYNNIPVNTTFFKFNTRDNYLVNLSNSNTLNLINETVYPTDCSLKYSFLNGNNANYVGMANCYREELSLELLSSSENIPLQLDVLGVDYKQGLFGKNYVEMTTYEDALDIIMDLKYSSVENINLTYLGWNKGGYFNASANNGKLHSSLGSKSDFRRLVTYMNDHNMTMDVTINPLISEAYGMGNQNVKKINLSSFDKKLKSSLEQVGYYTAPDVLAKNVLNNSKKYSDLGVYGLNIDNLSDSFSYRFDNKVVYRSDMIDTICNQLDQIEGYNISTTSPNAYLFNYLTNYYSASYESSKYLYETDSIPFISILLSGYVNLFSPQINYISDYNLMNLRMVEYNLYPSFIVTSEEAYDLRFTNFEYLNSTQYELWEELIKDTYNTVNNSLKTVSGCSIVNHRYIADGVCEVTYSNNNVIYINYTNTSYDNGSIQVGPNQCVVKEGV